MLRIALILVSVVYTFAVRGQSIRKFYKACNAVRLNSKFDATNSPWKYEYDKYSYGKTYRLLCDKVTTLYDSKIEKILIHVIETDTVNAIQIFLPFDSTFHRRMEADLGPSETAWMLFEPGRLDTAGIIRDRRWFLDDYIVWLRCTRYIPLLGEEKDNLLLITLFPRSMTIVNGDTRKSF